MVLDDDNTIKSHEASSRQSLIILLVLALILTVVGTESVVRWRQRHSGEAGGAKMHGKSMAQDEEAYDMSPNDAHVRAGHPGKFEL